MVEENTKEYKTFKAYLAPTLSKRQKLRSISREHDLIFYRALRFFYENYCNYDISCWEEVRPKVYEYLKANRPPGVQNTSQAEVVRIAMAAWVAFYGGVFNGGKFPNRKRTQYPNDHKLEHYGFSLPRKPPDDAWWQKIDLLTRNRVYLPTGSFTIERTKGSVFRLWLRFKGMVMPILMNKTRVEELMWGVDIRECMLQFVRVRDRKKLRRIMALAHRMRLGGGFLQQYPYGEVIEIHIRFRVRKQAKYKFGFAFAETNPDKYPVGDLETCTSTKQLWEAEVEARKKGESIFHHPLPSKENKLNRLPGRKERDRRQERRLRRRRRRISHKLTPSQEEDRTRRIVKWVMARRRGRIFDLVDQWIVCKSLGLWPGIRTMNNTVKAGRTRARAAQTLIKKLDLLGPQGPVLL